jgi:hypothetical protein
MALSAVPAKRRLSRLPEKFPGLHPSRSAGASPAATRSGAKKFPEEDPSPAKPIDPGQDFQEYAVDPPREDES